MKKIVVVLLVILVVLSGCSTTKLDGGIHSDDTLKALGVAYSAGEYTMTFTFCSGFVTSSQTAVWLAFPVAKQFLDGQTVTVNSINNTELRIDGAYIGEFHADLTPYVHSTRISNDGAVLFVNLENANKWMNSNNKVIPNNTPLAGIVDITFTVSDPT